MKRLDLDKLEPDPIASALANSEKELVVVTGFICSTDQSTISISETRNIETYTIYPRSAVISAFLTEKKGCGNDDELSKVTLIVYADARTKTVYNSTPATSSQIQMLRMRNNGSGCGTTCESGDGWSKCCCPVGQRCVSLSGTCRCENASEAFRYPTNGTGLPLVNAANSYEQVGSATNDIGYNMAMKMPGWNGAGKCYDKDGDECPKYCRPIIVDYKIVGWDCYCDCTKKK